MFVSDCRSIELRRNLDVKNNSLADVPKPIFIDYQAIFNRVMVSQNVGNVLRLVNAEVSKTLVDLSNDHFVSSWQLTLSFQFEQYLCNACTLTFERVPFVLPVRSNFTLITNAVPGLLCFWRAIGGCKSLEFVQFID